MTDAEILTLVDRLERCLLGKEDCPFENNGGDQRMWKRVLR